MDASRLACCFAILCFGVIAYTQICIAQIDTAWVRYLEDPNYRDDCKAVAVDAGEFNVTSNAVLPGWVRTEMAENSALAEARKRGITVEDIWKERAALYPPGRVVTPQEVAATIAFLASDEASGISGQAVTVALGAVW